MPLFQADLHLHTDIIPPRRVHGMQPSELAEALVNARLDVAAVTEHLPNLKSGGLARFAEVRLRLRDRLGEESPYLILGAEINAFFRGRAYHFGYLFEDHFEGRYWPDLPPDNMNLDDLVGPYRKHNPGVVIWNHPTWRDFSDTSRRVVTEDLFGSGLIDGIEIANGTMMMQEGHKGCDQKTSRALELFREKASSWAAPIGTSDAHRPDLVGSALTAFKGDCPQDVFRAIREKATAAVVVRQELREALSGQASGWLR